MSKYGDLTNIFWNTQDRNRAYHQALNSLAKGILERLRTNFEIPARNLDYLPLGNDVRDPTTGTFEDANGFGDDGWYRIRFRITFQTDHEKPAIPVAFTFAIRKDEEEEGWLVSTTEDGDDPSLIADATQAEDINKLCDTVFEEVRSFFSRSLTDRFQETPGTQIGFQT